MNGRVLSVARVGMIAATAALATLLAGVVGVERWFGDAPIPSVTFDVAVPYDAIPRGGTGEIERAWRTRLPGYRLRTGFAPHTDPHRAALRIEVIGAGAVDAPAVLRALVSSSRLEIRPVASGERVVEQWSDAVEHLGFDIGDARAHHDSWNTRAGDPRRDTYLAGPSLASVQRAADLLSREHPLPAGLSLAYEHVIPPRASRASGASPPYYRSYLLRDEVILANDDIASASVDHDPNTRAPEVHATLTRDATTRFGDATTRLVGDKLAILLDGAVMSAPVVIDPIRAGRVTISMGGTDAEQQEREARALVATLVAGARLPDGLDARLVRSTTGASRVVWPPRVAFGLIAGALAWLVARLADRRRLARAPAPPTTPPAA